jgi:prepilin-type N-terminal cleavage/methylation domain-containing protein
MRRQYAFTIVELLVSMSVIAVMVSILLPALGSSRQAARMTREMIAARSLMIAHAAYAQDFNFHLIPGYDNTATARDHLGNPLTFPSTARYAWRLGPYLDYQFKDSVLVNQRADELWHDIAANTYAVSSHPSFGINGDFVGGTWGGGFNNWLRGVGVTVTRADDAAQPSRLITFASARGGLSGIDPIHGYFIVQPAYGLTYREEDLPSTFGFVHPRYDSRAVVGLLDGHAGLLTVDQLRDRTYWCDAAARAGKPDWFLTDALN